MAVALLSTGIIFYVAVGSVLGRVMGDTTYSQLAVFNEVIRTVLGAYVEPVNLDRAMGGAYRGLTDALDGESAYLDAEAFKAYTKPGRGTEADVGLILTRRFAFLMVVATRPGSPAEQAELRTGDVIKTIDSRHTRPLSVQTGQLLLRGEPGSIVQLTILRAQADPVDVSLVRERLEPARPEGRRLEDGTGYLRVREVSKQTGEELRAEIEMLRRAGAERLVLDLREAAYGPVAEGVGVAELFMKGGVVARLSGRKLAEQELTADPDRNAWDQPLVVLTSRGTAGASEVVAAALLESERATLVGDQTFGIAPVQRAFPLPEGGLLLTVAKFSSPKGNPIHGRGVEPNVRVVAPAEEEDGQDAVLERALEILNGDTLLDKAA